MDLYCIKHPYYKGKLPPALKCQACCHIFIQEVKRMNAAGQKLPDYSTQLNHEHDVQTQGNKGSRLKSSHLRTR